jgi:hypothetical protein
MTLTEIVVLVAVLLVAWAAVALLVILAIPAL